MPVKHIARVHFGGTALGSNPVCVQRTTSPLRALIMQGLGKGGHKHTKGADAGKGATPCSMCAVPITHFLRGEPQYWMPYFRPVCHDCFYAWDGHEQANARVVAIAEALLLPPVSQHRGTNEGGKRQGKGRDFGVCFWCRGQLEIAADGLPMPHEGCERAAAAKGGGNSEDKGKRRGGSSYRFEPFSGKGRRLGD